MEPPGARAVVAIACFWWGGGWLVYMLVHELSPQTWATAHPNTTGARATAPSRKREAVHYVNASEPAVAAVKSAESGGHRPDRLV